MTDSHSEDNKRVQTNATRDERRDMQGLRVKTAYYRNLHKDNSDFMILYDSLIGASFEEKFRAFKRFHLVHKAKML